MSLKSELDAIRDRLTQIEDYLGMDSREPDKEEEDDPNEMTDEDTDFYVIASAPSKGLPLYFGGMQRGKPRWINSRDTAKRFYSSELVRAVCAKLEAPEGHGKPYVW